MNKGYNKCKEKIVSEFCSDEKICLDGYAIKGDTYVEDLFLEALKCLKNGNDIARQWLIDKEIAIKYIERTKLDFDHYSDHDRSHSENILEAIKLLIGECRLKQLSAGDLWLLLEAAYFHDIGMSIDFDELKKIWMEDESFKEFFREGLYKENLSDRQYFEYIDSIDKLIMSDVLENIDEENESDFGSVNLSDDWVVTLPKYIKIITAEFVRKKHGEFAKNKIKELNTNPIIEDRLYTTVAEIAWLHTCEFGKIFDQLNDKISIFGTTAHPQFIAQLLRVGDLLDMDNNRFDLLTLKHFGKLPFDSQLHFKKHKALDILYINKYQIKAVAKSDEESVCNCAFRWFTSLNDEVKNLICNWSAIAPSQLGGCLMRLPNLKVFYNESEYNNKSKSYYDLEKKYAMRLLIGENIYTSSLDFLREYLQNAIDATKHQFWKDVVTNRLFDYWHKLWLFEPKDMTPFDYSEEIYFRYPIKITIENISKWNYDEIDEEEPFIRFTISDMGTGIEEEGIKSLTVIGSGWRNRKNYYDEIKKMPVWLRPTAGFGIGTQSAFMAAKEVVYETRSDNEIDGHRIRLTSPDIGGEITIEKIKNRHRGTDVIIDIALSDILDNSFWKNSGLEINKIVPITGNENRIIYSDDIIKSKVLLLDQVVDRVKLYIEEMLGGICMFPVQILKKTSDVINGEYNIGSMHMYGPYLSENSNEFSPFKYNEKTYLVGWYVDVSPDDNKHRMHFSVIDQSDYTFTEIESLGRHKDLFSKGECKYYYKGIRIKEEKDDIYFMNTCIDIHSTKVADSLQLHRNAFVKNYDRENLKNDSLKILFNIMFNMALDGSNDFTLEFDMAYFLLALKYTTDDIIKKIYDIRKENEIENITNNINLDVHISAKYGDIVYTLLEQNDTELDYKVMLDDILFDSKIDNKVLLFRIEENSALEIAVKNNNYELLKNRKPVRLVEKYAQEIGCYRIKEELLEKIVDFFMPVADIEIVEQEPKDVTLNKGKTYYISFKYKNNKENIDKEASEAHIKSVDEFFGLIESGKAQIYVRPDEGLIKYNKLFINNIPLNDIKDESPVLLSPFNRKIKNMVHGDSKAKIMSIETLIQKIEQNEELNTLIDWVWKNQYAEEKVSKAVIRHEYKEMIKEYIKWYYKRKR